MRFVGAVGKQTLEVPLFFGGYPLDPTVRFSSSLLDTHHQGLDFPIKIWISSSGFGFPHQVFKSPLDFGFPHPILDSPISFWIPHQVSRLPIG